MSFNVVDIILVIIIGFSCFTAYRKGFLLTFYKLVSFFIAIWVAWIVNPIIKGVLIDYTKLDTWLYDKLNGGLKNIITESIENGTLSQKEEAIGKINIPNILKQNLITQMENTENQNNLLDFITEHLTDICINIISFVLVIIVSLIILAVIKGLLSIISEIPIIEQANKVLGLAFGILIASLRIWLIFLIIGLFSNVETPGIIVRTITSSWIGNFYYQNNLISYVILKLLS